MTVEVDRGALYLGAVARVGDLVRDVAADGTRPVPATPGWTVHDVVAHVAGVARDAVTGNLEGAPGEAWTAAQVARGRGVATADLLAQWAQDAPGLAAFLSSPDGAAVSAAVFDVHCHEADLRAALGLPLAVTEPFLAWCADAFRTSFAGAAAAAGLPPVAPDASDLDWFRGRLGRRTEAEVRAWSWPVDPAPYLPLFFLFGRAERPLGERP